MLDVLMASKELASPHKIIVEKIYFEVMALAVRLPELKADLVKLLRQYNTKVKELLTREVSKTSFSKSMGGSGLPSTSSVWPFATLCLNSGQRTHPRHPSVFTFLGRSRLCEEGLFIDYYQPFDSDGQRTGEEQRTFGHICFQAD